MRGALVRTVPRPPPPQLLVLFLFGVTHCISFLNWLFYIHPLRPTLKPAIVDSYLAFSVVGSAVFFLLASPIIYWTYIQADEISLKTRRNATCAGISICFLLYGFPMEWIELYLIWYHGWRSIVSGISLFLVSLNFAVGFFTTWIGYTWFVSRILQFSSSSRYAESTEMPWGLGFS